MKEPIHEFKKFVHYVNDYKPPYWYYDGRPCWLGSGIKDKNGVEIFEGDRITANGYPCTIKYKSLIWYMVPDNPAMAELLLCWHQNYEIEVIGHIAEEADQ